MCVRARVCVRFCRLRIQRQWHRQRHAASQPCDLGGNRVSCRAIMPCPLLRVSCTSPLRLLGDQRAGIASLTRAVLVSCCHAWLDFSAPLYPKVAYGFIRVANEAMCRPIRNLTTMKVREQCVCVCTCSVYMRSMCA